MTLRQPVCCIHFFIFESLLIFVMMYSSYRLVSAKRDKDLSYINICVCMYIYKCICMYAAYTSAYVSLC